MKCNDLHLILVHDITEEEGEWGCRHAAESLEGDAHQVSGKWKPCLLYRGVCFGVVRRSAAVTVDMIPMHARVVVVE